MIKKCTAVVALQLILSISIAGCSDSSTTNTASSDGNAAYDTATVTMTAIINAGDNSDAIKQLTLQQPEFRSINLCVARQLELQGWTREQHNFLMQETKNTGNIALINQSKFSEAQALKHFGPLFIAQSSCM